MQPDENPLARLPEVIQKATAGVIVLPSNPSVDALAAGTALYLGLVKLGKTVNLVCETNPKSDIIAADKVQHDLTTSGDNLVISFPYVDGAIDKVDYNIQGETFNLVITPRSGRPKLEPSEVQYSYSGGSVDFIITIDAPNLTSLGKIYTENREQFQGKTIINVDRHLVNDFYGVINLVNKTSSSTSELILRFLKEIEVEIDKDIATNLYAGITTATNNFSSYSVNADTFEAAAVLLRLGALKKQLKQNQPSFVAQKKQQFPSGQRPTPLPTAPAAKQTKPIEMVETETHPEASNEASQDWLKPKIFRGTGLL